MSVREGVLYTLSYLPVSLAAPGSASTGGFGPFLEHDALPVILGGLGDEMESVREVALKAGQVTYYNHIKFVHTFVEVYLVCTLVLILSLFMWQLFNLLTIRRFHFVIRSLIFFSLNIY